MFIPKLIKKDYVYREQTVIWKHPETNEYKFYYSIILETHGFNRFDYSAFNYGDLPFQNDVNVTVYRLQMKEKQIRLNHNTYLLDDSIWNPVYKKYITQFSKVF